LVPEGTQDAVQYRRFWAFVSTPEVDFVNSIVTKEAVLKAWPEYIKHGNSRLMHSGSPAGRIFDGDYEIRDQGIYAGVSVPIHKEEILKDLDSCLLNGFSLGFNVDSWEDVEYDEARGVLIFKAIRIFEVSIVDSGATPGTDFQEERNADSMSAMSRLLGLFRNITLGKSPNNPLEDQMFGKDKAKETPVTIGDLQPILEEQNKGVLTAVTNQLTEWKTAFMTEVKSVIAEATKTPEPEKKETPVNDLNAVVSVLKGIGDSMKALGTKVESLEAQNKELRTFVGTEEVLDAGSRNAVGELAGFLKTQSEKEPKNVPFLGGLVRSKMVGGNTVRDGNQLLGGN
jgi:hypothetical protein